MPDGKLIRIGKAAQLLGVSTMTLRRWADQGKMRSFQVGPGRGERRFLEEDILALLRERGGGEPKELG